MFAQVEDFLKDDDFIRYVLEETPELLSRWETYFIEHTGQKVYAEEARAILQAPTDVACDLSADESRELKYWILETIEKLD